MRHILSNCITFGIECKLILTIQAKLAFAHSLACECAVIYHICLVHLYCWAPPHSAVADGVGPRGKGLPAAYLFSLLSCGVAETVLPKKPHVAAQGGGLSIQSPDPGAIYSRPP